MILLENFNFFSLYLLFVFFATSFIRKKRLHQATYLLVGSVDIFEYFIIQNNLINAILLFFVAIFFCFLQNKIIKTNLNSKNLQDFKFNHISDNIISDRLFKRKNVSNNIKLIENLAMHKNGDQDESSFQKDSLNDKIIKIEKELSETRDYLSSFIEKMDETFDKLNELSRKKVF